MENKKTVCFEYNKSTLFGKLEKIIKSGDFVVLQLSLTDEMKSAFNLRKNVFFADAKYCRII